MPTTWTVATTGGPFGTWQRLQAYTWVQLQAYTWAQLSGAPGWTTTTGATTAWTGTTTGGPFGTWQRLQAYTWVQLQVYAWQQLSGVATWASATTPVMAGLVLPGFGPTWGGRGWSNYIDYGYTWAEVAALNLTWAQMNSGWTVTS